MESEKEEVFASTMFEPGEPGVVWGGLTREDAGTKAINHFTTHREIEMQMCCIE